MSLFPFFQLPSSGVVYLEQLLKYQLGVWVAPTTNFLHYELLVLTIKNIITAVKMSSVE